jgi:hypothetical protein
VKTLEPAAADASTVVAAAQPATEPITEVDIPLPLNEDGDASDTESVTSSALAENSESDNDEDAPATNKIGGHSSLFHQLKQQSKKSPKCTHEQAVKALQTSNTDMRSDMT